MEEPIAIPDEPDICGSSEAASLHSHLDRTSIHLYPAQTSTNDQHGSRVGHVRLSEQGQLSAPVKSRSSASIRKTLTLLGIALVYIACLASSPILLANASPAPIRQDVNRNGRFARSAGRAVDVFSAPAVHGYTDSKGALAADATLTEVDGDHAYYITKGGPAPANKLSRLLLSLSGSIEQASAWWLEQRETSIWLYYYRPRHTGAPAFTAGQHDAISERRFVKRAEELSTANKVEAAMIPFLVILSGIFAGSTLGYFSVDPTQLQVLSTTGTEKQQKLARKVMPIRAKGHLLLTTLVLANMIVNEALPVVAEVPLGGGIYAVIASTVLVVIFAEIIPQSVCSRYGLWVGAKMAWPVRILIWFFFPIAWPVAKLLEWVLGAHHGIIYRRAELKELINMHAAGGTGGGDLDLDTVTMTRGALGLQDKNVKDAMTPIDSVFMLPIEAKLDYETLGQVVKSGHSRIPVYQLVDVPDVSLTTAPAPGSKGSTRMVRRVIGCLLVKQCVLLDPEDATPLSSVPINAIPMVPWDEPLTNMLNAFQEGRSHMAIVSRRARYKPLEADEASIMTSTAVKLHKRLLNKISEKVRGGDSSGSGSDSDEEGTTLHSSGTDAEKGNSPQKGGKQKHNDDKPAKKTSSMIANAAKLNNQEQSFPADAQLGKEGVEKFFEGLEGAPLGIITLEDVLEELIGEEIFDEYDPPSETGHDALPASSFVPAEAKEAAEAAALKRQAEAEANGNVKQATEGAVAEPTKRESTPIGRRLPKLSSLSVPKFTGMKRTTSQPASKRTGDVVKMPEVGGGEPNIKPIARSSTVDESFTGNGGPQVLTAEPAQLARSRSQDDLAQDKEPKRASKHRKSRSGSRGSGDEPHSASRKSSIVVRSAPTSRPSSTDGVKQASKPLGIGAMTPMNKPAVSAVPARLLVGSAEPAIQAPAVQGQTSSVPPPNPAAPLPMPLNEALLVERGRRRIAATGGTPASAIMQPAGPVGAGPGLAAGLLPPAVSRSQSAGPGQLPTAGVPGSIPPAPAQGTSTVDGILSPIPRKTPRFKSIPAVASGPGTPTGLSTGSGDTPPPV